METGDSATDEGALDAEKGCLPRLQRARDTVESGSAMDRLVPYAKECDSDALCLGIVSASDAE